MFFVYIVFVLMFMMLLLIHIIFMICMLSYAYGCVCQCSGLVRALCLLLACNGFCTFRLCQCCTMQVLLLANRSR